VYAYAALCGLLHLGLKLNRRADEVALTIAEPLAEPMTGAPAFEAVEKLIKIVTEAIKPTVKKTMASRLARI
jgi:hypothetical protein